MQWDSTASHALKRAVRKTRGSLLRLQTNSDCKLVELVQEIFNSLHGAGIKTDWQIKIRMRKIRNTLLRYCSLSAFNPNRSFVDSIQTAMSLCIRYLIHLSHGNNFRNGEHNPPFFATWWSFFPFCPVRSCCKLHRRFKMLPQGHGQKSTGLRDNCPFPQQTPRSVPVGIALSGASERSPGS